MTGRAGALVANTLRRAGIVMRFVRPGRAVRAQVRTIKRSGLFDRDFYFASNPRLRRLFRLAPERHYLLFGEPMGLCPNPAFSPRAYAFNNPDIGAAPPLLHFIETGQAEGRTVLDTAPLAPLALPRIGPGDRPAPPAPHAVVLHLYYHDLWDEFAERLAAQTLPFDLYVTATGTTAEVAPLRARVLDRFAHARVWAMPNHGRDIFPFLHLVNSGLLAPYAAVCKLHGKRSPHRSDGDAWRGALTGGVLGPPGPTAARLGAFLARPDLGLWTADGQIMTGPEWWGINRAPAAAALGRPVPGALRFPAGSIYWVKPPVLAQLAALGLGPDRFEREQGLVDGTMAHALERLIGPLTEAAGLAMCTTSDLDP